MIAVRARRTCDVLFNELCGEQVKYVFYVVM